MKHAPDWILVGMVKRIHGRDGEMLISPLTDRQERFLPGAELWLTRKRSDEHLPVRIASSRTSDLGPLVKLEGVDTREQAMQYFGASLFIPATELAEPGVDSYYPFQLAGCELFEGGRRVGEVISIHQSQKANPFLEVDPGTGEKPLFIPFIKAIITRVDLELRRIEIIEGFLG